jgi:radical SAM protein with 4Fe4S-binding SPASM domain
MNLRRIRVDNFGLITQTSQGKLERIVLDRPTIDGLRCDITTGLHTLCALRPELDQYFTADGQLVARVDIADEPAECLSRPLRIYYNIEPRCNLNCPFCGPRDLHGWSIKASAEEEELLLSQIGEAGTFQVQLTGGEIFIRGWGLFRTLERTREIGLATLLGTNGVWNHIKDRDSFLRELADFDHIVEIKVSVDGNRQFHDSVRGPGTYDEAVKTLFDLSEAGFTTRINTTIFRESCTIEQIEHLANLARQANAGLQAIPERSCGRAKGKTAYDLPSTQALRAYTIRAKELREQLGIAISFNFDIFGGARQLSIYDPGRPFSCGAGLWGFAVTHLGEVYPCGFSIEIGKPPKFLVGVISQASSILDLWLHSPVLSEWRHAGKASECQQCENYQRTCWGGCMVQAYVTKGSLSAPDPYCLRDQQYLSVQRGLAAGTV